MTKVQKWFKWLLIPVILLILVLVCFLLPHWLWHPLGFCTGSPKMVEDCKGYGIWSGIGSDVGEVTLIGGLVGLYMRTTCHQDGCFRPRWHIHPGHGHPVCKKHYREHPDGVIPGEADS